MSRKSHMLVFDDFVTATSGAPVYTKTELNDALGENDQTALQAVVDQVNANGSITVRIQHSGDQINFVNRNASAEINGAAITTNTTNVLTGNDAGATPGLGYARLQIYLATTAQAHVKIWATQRNQG